MGLRYENLDAETRALMVEEIIFDRDGDGLYQSRYLNAQGIQRWADLTIEAARSGNDDTLAAELARGLLVTHYSKRTPKGGMTMARVPYNAHTTLAEGQFNMYYMRALARRGLRGDAEAIEVYRARYSEVPRAESERLIGTTLDPQVVLDELRRTKGVEPDIRVPLPNTGVTVRLR